MLDTIRRDYMTATEAARLLHVSRQRVLAMKDHATFPKGERLFGVTLFKRAEVEAWAETRRGG